MQSYMELSSADLATIIASIIAGAAFVLSTYTYLINTSRERKIKTLDYWNSSYNTLIEAKEILYKLHKGQWDEDIALEKLSNNINRNHILKGLNVFEHLATGINLNIYDLNVLNRLGGDLLKNAFLEYCILLAVIEKDPDINCKYTEFKILYSKLESLR